MKKNAILFCALTFGVFTNILAQEPVEFIITETLDSTYSKEIIFNKIHLWIVDRYVSANDVIQMADKEMGIFVVKGRFEYSGCGRYNSSYRGWILHTLTIKIKDNRYRIEITNLSHESWQNGAHQTSLGQVYDHSLNVKGMNAKWAQKHIRPDIIEKMKIKSKVLSYDIKQSIIANDDW